MRARGAIASLRFERCDTSTDGPSASPLSGGKRVDFPAWLQDLAPGRMLLSGLRGVWDIAVAGSKITTKPARLLDTLAWEPWCGRRDMFALDRPILPDYIKAVFSGVPARGAAELLGESEGG